MLSKAKQSKAKLLLFILIYNYFKFLFQKYFLNLVKSFLTLIKFNFDSLSRKIKNPCLVINKNFLFYLRRYCEIKKNYLLSLILEFDFKIFLEYTIMYNYSKYL